MKLKLPFLGCAFILTIGVFAQQLPSTNQAKLWYKNAETKSSAGPALNGYSPLQFDNASKTKLLHNFQSKNANFYIVFKSQDKDTVGLINYHFKCTEATLHTRLTDPNVKDPKELQRKIETGAIFKHEFSLPYDENRVNDNFFMIQDRPKDQTDIYEVLYFDTAFTLSQHQQIQTYLALKYGITLLDLSNYRDAHGKALWTTPVNSEKYSHVIGIGRNDDSGLYQKSTSNSTDSFLQLSTSNEIEPNTFILVGDNHRDLNFVKKGNDYILNRTWLAQSSGEVMPLTQLRFDVSQLPTFDRSKTYYLQISRNQSAYQFSDQNDLIEGKIIDHALVFDNVAWNTESKGVDAFTLSYSNAKQPVKPSLVLEDWEVYPNPVKVNEPFEIRMNWPKESSVSISIYQSNGKRVLYDTFEANGVKTYQANLSSNGTHIIVVSAQGKSSVKKIVVK